jgi:hypothetical protein
MFRISIVINGEQLTDLLEQGYKPTRITTIPDGSVKAAAKVLYRNGHTQQMIADLLGVTQPAVGEWLNTPEEAK